MRNYKATLILALLLIALPAFSQDSVRSPYLRIVKVSPVNLLFYYQSLQLAYEHQFTRKISAQAEAGMVFDFKPHYMENLEYLNKRGARLKAEFRFYPMGLWLNKPSFYASVEPYYNIINFDRDVIQNECADLNCNTIIQHRYVYLVKYREQGVSLKYGLQMSRDRFVVDFSVGLRARFVNYIKPGYTEGFDDTSGEDFDAFQPNEEKRVTPGIITDIKLGYRFGRNPKTPVQLPPKRYIERF